MNTIDGFLALMARGGPLMWVIFLTAWAALVMLAERALRLQRWLQAARRDRTALETHAPAASAISPIALLLARLDWAQIHDRNDLAQQLNGHLAELMPRLEGSLPTVALLASLLPMLGLLGTVTGMIEVFQAIAVHGSGHAEQLAGGISQALLTTASGLLAALPVLFAHHLLVRRLRLLLAITEQSLRLVHQRGLPPAPEPAR